MVHGTKTRPEAFLNAEDTKMWKRDILGGNNGSLTSLLLDMRESIDETAGMSDYASINNNESVIIEKAEVNMNVKSVAT